MSTGPAADPSAAAKAAVLVESLPYIRRFLGDVVVVKYGGNVLQAKPGQPAVDEATALASFAEDIVLMRSVGMLPVVVHGGGPQIGALMERVGKVAEFHDGFRVTDADTIDLVRMVLVGKVNRDIVSTVNVHGALAVGLSGEDANLITATARSEALGFVGDVVAVDPSIVLQLLAQGLIPVVATIGTDASGQAFNINADAAAGALATALEAEKLVFLTDVAGLRADPDDPATLITGPPPTARRHGGIGGGHRGDDPQGGGVRPCGAPRGAPRPHPRRPDAARPAARALHRRGRGHDGGGRP